MKSLKMIATIIRRVVIVIFGILLIIEAINLIPWNSNDKAFITSLEQDGPVNKFVINKTMDMDGDKFTLKKLYSTPKQTVLEYSIKKQDPGGWSFAESAIKIVTSNGEELTMHSGSSSGNHWGATGYINFDELKDPSGNITIKYDWYDRHATYEIPLTKDGEGQ
ncbi:DUF5643 domain-containing protein [Paenibacillus segetis]|uniref:DUF5643 domain-containing protein n=1 Tax=Paenibacillus segetis TaxID=1325360 RepID=A0ABQ1YEA5_9BACL|nr:DUF5643 domain-containing protein [Paenibacillus segetis]GGH21793.1 hypothetical protein GCM10008013_19900 [Paenibacillus segetis]